MPDHAQLGDTSGAHMRQCIVPDITSVTGALNGLASHKTIRIYISCGIKICNAAPTGSVRWVRNKGMLPLMTVCTNDSNDWRRQVVVQRLKVIT